MDLAGLIPEAERARIGAVCDALRTETGTQLFVLTVPSIGVYTEMPMHISSFASLALRELHSAGLAPGEDAGARSLMLVISENEKRGHVQLFGPWKLDEYDLSRRIRDEQLDSRLQRGEFSQAIVAGVAAADRLARGIELPRKPVSWLALLKTLARPMLMVALVAMLFLRYSSGLLNRFTPVKKLHGLARDGNAAGILKQLERGALANEKDVLGLAPIHYAARASYERVVGHLLDYGADPNSQTPEGETCLFFLAKRGDAKMIETLLARGASMDHLAKDGSFPLLVAVTNSQHIVAKVLLAHGADIERHNPSGQTSLHASVERGIIKCARLLLDHGANPNVYSHDGNTPLVTAIKNHNTEIGELLISNGADVDARREHGNTALIQAVLEESLGCIQMLLEAGADPHAKIEMTTYISVANLENRLEFTKTASALELAKSKGKTDIVKTIVSYEAKAAHHHNILNAIRDDDTEGLEAIIEIMPYIVNLRTRTKRWTPLVAAVHGGHKRIAELLIEKGANVNIRTRKGHTPLMYAASLGKFDIAKMLIKAKAEVLIRLVDGKSAADLAEENGHLDLAKFLKSREAASDSRMTIHGAVGYGDVKRVAQLLHIRPKLANLRTFTSGWSPLHLAVADRNVPIVGLLLANGADVNARSKKGKTALHLAAGEGSAEMLKMLLQRRASVTSRYKGETPLERAVQRSQTDAADLLQRYAAASS